MRSGLALPLLIAAGLFATPGSSLTLAEPYPEIIRQDAPAAWWRFDEVDAAELMDTVEQLTAHTQGKVMLGQPGPVPSEFPDFAPANRAIGLQRGQYLVVADPGARSVLDFAQGDSITLEAWVRWDGALEGGFPYIISKGRTHNPGTSRHNQNYSLRIANKANASYLSFFFCDDETPEADAQEIGTNGHRWTSTTAIPNDGTWHHLAVSYAFGNAESLAGYIDGVAVEGVWDMGGATDKAPAVDDDDLWIGSAMAGHSTFAGSIDEVAIYRSVLTGAADRPTLPGESFGNSVCVRTG